MELNHKRPTQLDARLDTDFIKFMNKLPTPDHLALIAATLARNTNDAPDTLADAALKLWFSAREKIHIADEDQELSQHDQIMECRNDSPFVFEPYFPQIPDEFPISRDRFLQLMLPQYKDRADKLAQIGKAYVHDVLLIKKKDEKPTKDEINNAYGKWRPCKNSDQAEVWAKSFVGWRESDIKRKKHDAGLQSGKTRKGNKLSQKQIK